MDATLRRFIETNVEWPGANHFYIPAGGLLSFLQANLRLKVVLVTMPIFDDVYTAGTVKYLTTPQWNQLQHRVLDIVQHTVSQTCRTGGSVSILPVFCSADPPKQIPNKFRIEYTLPAVPAEAAWMFHVILVHLVVIGFEWENTCCQFAWTAVHDQGTGMGHVFCDAYFFVLSFQFVFAYSSSLGMGHIWMPSDRYHHSEGSAEGVHVVGEEVEKENVPM
ncbi:hypothetical protein B0H19DRAFT_1086009 [Mycena capillaripes]|nr:hypothetical protein B0H19DRAFT_1086009 [Mycena capillaripes]